MHNFSMENLDQFVDRLVEEKGFGSQEADVLIEIKKDVSDRVEARVNALIASSIPAEKLAAFEKVLDSSSAEEIAAFVKEQVPDIQERIAAELLVFKAEYLG